MLKEGRIRSGEVVQVKLTGDGTKICRKLNLINFCFTVLNEGDLTKSPRGNHTIAIINSTEKYEDLEIALSDIQSEVQTLTSITFDGMNFPIEYFLCSDLKFLAIICGIESATCKHACIWCKCPASERHNMKAEWSFTGNGACSIIISEIQICCKQPKAKRFNCTNMPLFPSILIDHTIVGLSLICSKIYLLFFPELPKNFTCYSYFIPKHHQLFLFYSIVSMILSQYRIGYI